MRMAASRIGSRGSAGAPRPLCRAGFSEPARRSLALSRSALARTGAAAAGRHGGQRRPACHSSTKSASPMPRIVWCWSTGGLRPDSRRSRGCRRAFGSARRRQRSARGRSWSRAALEALSHDGDQPFAALNAAFFTDGFVLDVAPGIVVWSSRSRSSISLPARFPARCTPAAWCRSGRKAGSG